MQRLFPLLALAACAPVDAPPIEEEVRYDLTSEPSTTLQRVWAPRVPPAATLDAIDAGTLTVYALDRFLDAGLGVEEAPGNPRTERNELAPDFVPGPAAGRRSLLWFWQLADPQLIDEESPIRMEAFTPLYRPQGHLSVQVLEAHVRSVQRLVSLTDRPLDFAVIAGDLTDGSQQNELAWFTTALNGGRLNPDSGVDDDPVPGPGNDYNDPFWSDGLDAPWYAALGNHETQYNGGFGLADEAVRAASVSGDVYDAPIGINGYCDGSQVNAPLRTVGPTPADPQRLVLNRPEVLAALHEAPGEPAGHGLSAADVAAGRGWFSAHPVPDRPLRLVVLDTVNTDGGVGLGSEGRFDEAQHTWLVAQLNEADAAHELVIVVSHHRPKEIGGSSPVSGDALTATLAASPGVVLHLCGHIHDHASRLVPAVAHPGPGYWELTLGSTVDFPMQTRLFELVDEGNGFLTIYATNLDHDSPEGSLAHEGRALAAAKRVFGEFGGAEDVGAFWTGDVPDQNLVLRTRLPTEVASELARHTWPTRIESEATLDAL